MGIGKRPAPVIRVRSKINREVYYYSADYPTREVDGIVFVGIKKNKSDRNTFFINKESIETIDK